MTTLTTKIIYASLAIVPTFAMSYYMFSESAAKYAHTYEFEVPNTVDESFNSKWIDTVNSSRYPVFSLVFSKGRNDQYMIPFNNNKNLGSKWLVVSSVHVDLSSRSKGYEIKLYKNNNSCRYQIHESPRSSLSHVTNHSEVIEEMRKLITGHCK